MNNGKSRCHDSLWNYCRLVKISVPNVELFAGE